VALIIHPVLITYYAPLTCQPLLRFPAFFFVFQLRAVAEVVAGNYPPDFLSAYPPDFLSAYPSLGFISYLCVPLPRIWQASRARGSSGVSVFIRLPLVSYGYVSVTCR